MEPTARPNDARRAAVSDFVRRTFGFRGTLALHRWALGPDLVIAPLNVALAPAHVVFRLIGLFAASLGARRLARWIGQRRLLMPGAVARRVATLVRDLVEGLGIKATVPEIEDAIADYVAVRSAVSEIATTLIVIAAGLLLFGAATPGVISLSSPVSEMVARATAVADFPFGTRLGGLYYRVFPVELPPRFVVATGICLAMLASLVTTFAGILADPLQVALGIHSRRLHRLLDTLERPGARPGLAREHLAARAADVGDILASVVRAFRP